MSTFIGLRAVLIVRGARLARCGGGCGIILRRDRWRRGKRAIASGLYPGRLGLCLRAGEVGRRLVGGGAIEAGVDLIARLALLDVRPLGKEAAADDAGALRASLGGLVCFVVCGLVGFLW